MKIDFWQLSRDPVDKVVALIAARVVGDGERLLVVSADSGQREAIARALWESRPAAFLANGEAGLGGVDRGNVLGQVDPQWVVRRQPKSDRPQ